MILYFIRHGQTDYNLREIIQGCTDIPLNATGKAQAEIVRSLLKEKNITYTKIYCSPLGRTKTTCEIVTGVDRSKFNIDPRLREIEVGSIAGASFYDERQEVVDFMKHPETYVPPEGAESYQQLIDRVGSFLEDMKKEDPNEKILIACHRGTIQAAIMYIRKNIPVSDFRKISVPNAAVLEVVLENGEFRITNLYRNEENELNDNAAFFEKK